MSSFPPVEVNRIQPVASQAYIAGVRWCIQSRIVAGAGEWRRKMGLVFLAGRAARMEWSPLKWRQRTTRDRAVCRCVGAGCRRRCGHLARYEYAGGGRMEKFRNDPPLRTCSQALLQGDQ